MIEFFAETTTLTVVKYGCLEMSMGFMANSSTRLTTLRAY